jgi:hypothetical protein
MVFFALLVLAGTRASSQEYYDLTQYNYTGEANEARLDTYFKNALVPALHRMGIKSVGVFKSSSLDTSSIRKFFLLIPITSLDFLDNIHTKLEKDKTYQSAGADYINAKHNESPYLRIEKMVLKAFSGMPKHKKSTLTGDKTKRVYELRSYEGPTEKLYRTKVKMFNTGDEIGLFERLGFNAIFYAEVLAGSHMPNLMYITTFDDKQSRDEHWKAFGQDPQWKKLTADKQYDNTVSHMDIHFLYPAEYSDL